MMKKKPSWRWATWFNKIYAEKYATTRKRKRNKQACNRKGRATKKQTQHNRTEMNDAAKANMAKIQGNQAGCMKGKST